MKDPEYRGEVVWSRDKRHTLGGGSWLESGGCGVFTKKKFITGRIIFIPRGVMNYDGTIGVLTPVRDGVYYSNFHSLQV